MARSEIEGSAAGAGWSEALTFGDLLRRSAARHPGRTAVAFPDESRTYAELLEGAERVARGLLSLGVDKGDHVGILMPNCVEFLEAFFGVAMAGAVVVPLNVHYRATEAAYVVEHSDLAVLLTCDGVDERADFAALVHDALPSLAGAADPTRLDLPEMLRLRAVATLRGEGSGGILGADRYAELATEIDAAAVAESSGRVRLRDVGLLLYTSGTTARPKGCMLAHETLGRGAMARIRESVPERDHHVLWSGGPWFHVASLQVLIGSIGLAGTFLTDTRFDPGRAIELMKRERVTSAWPWLPQFAQALLEDPSFEPRDFAEIDGFMVGWPRQLMERALELMPGAVVSGACGMSETAGSYTMSRPGDSNEQRASSSGKPLRGIEVRVVDPESGAELPPDTPGEALIRGYSLMEGYYKDPEATAAAIDGDGWMHSQDLYVKTPAGDLVFQGRLKDILKVGGENVSPVEVEATLNEHPTVKHAEVVGIPDPRLDEVPVAFVELNPGEELGEEELILFCRERLAGLKVPRRIEAIEEWPMSASKVDKRRLRDLALAAAAAP
jgi:fatty-acyl-CoA synthase/long-chain acyl-CoA synthetase